MEQRQGGEAKQSHVPGWKKVREDSWGVKEKSKLFVHKKKEDQGGDAQGEQGAALLW